MGYGFRVVGFEEGSRHLVEPMGWCKSKSLFPWSEFDGLHNIKEYLRARGHVAVPLESKVGPRSRILNQIFPDPSKDDAV